MDRRSWGSLVGVFNILLAWTVSFLRYMLLLSARETVYLHGLTAELEAGRCRTDYIATPVNTKLQTLFSQIQPYSHVTHVSEFIHRDFRVRVD